MNQPTNTSRTAGFTLIELMLSMTFVSVLLLTIALTVIQMATVYNRGMTLKEVNQSARDISDDLRRSFASSQVFSINVDGSDSSDYIKVGTGTSTVGGRLCTGTDSYIWNFGRALEANDSLLTRTLSSSGAQEAPIRFVRVPDRDKIYCLKDGVNPANRHITNADARNMTDLLDVGDHKLALHSFKVTTTNEAHDPSINQRLYSVTYTIGSGSVSAMNLTATPIKCLDPSDPNSNLTYCNVQQFTIVLRVGYTVN